MKISLQRNARIIASWISECESTDQVIASLSNLIEQLYEQGIPKQDRILFWELVSEEINRKRNSKINYITTSLEDLVLFAIQNIEEIIQEEKKLGEEEKK
ncbi:hypothetical protein N7X28_22765 [Bacillus sp. SM-B1]|uniref:hypothetical protein n=1 Tax=Bacillus sp. SM-B1 TaxID=2980102 RepID=UPI002949AF79|nr:hypothetical protein [Bacillus sp. SM-B1]MDV6039290.1 hypothetical protein [Bacillus sp. SM-B1]